MPLCLFLSVVVSSLFILIKGCFSEKALFIKSTPSLSVKSDFFLISAAEENAPAFSSDADDLYAFGTRC